MRLKVRRGGMSALVVLAGTSLLSTSTALAVHSVRDGRTVKLRVPNTASSSSSNAVAWIVGATGASDSLRAAHALAAENGRLEDNDDQGGQVTLIAVKVGRSHRLHVLTNAATVGDLIQALGVKVRRPDLVRPAADSAIRSRTLVRVIRIRHVRRTETVEVPFETLIHHSKELAAGQTKILTAGVPGLARITYLITMRNGREEYRTVESEAVVVTPVNQVEEKGSGAPAAGSGTQVGQATWYDWYGCGDGYHAAHLTLPFGTKVTVTNVDNGYSVTVTINDRGPYVSGRIIDLCSTAFAALAPLGQGVANVEITW
jgi:Lytic transglycolase/G5 domain